MPASAARMASGSCDTPVSAASSSDISATPKKSPAIRIPVMRSPVDIHTHLNQAAVKLRRLLKRIGRILPEIPAPLCIFFRTKPADLRMVLFGKRIGLAVRVFRLDKGQQLVHKFGNFHGLFKEFRYICHPGPYRLDALSLDFKRMHRQRARKVRHIRAEQQRPVVHKPVAEARLGVAGDFIAAHLYVVAAGKRGVQAERTQKIDDPAG